MVLPYSGLERLSTFADAWSAKYCPFEAAGIVLPDTGFEVQLTPPASGSPAQACRVIAGQPSSTGNATGHPAVCLRDRARHDGWDLQLAQQVFEACDILVNDLVKTL